MTNRTPYMSTADAKAYEQSSFVNQTPEQAAKEKLKRERREEVAAIQHQAEKPQSKTDKK